MDKFTSRKFMFTLFWCSLIPIGMVISYLLGKELSYMGQIITFAGTTTGAYMTVQGIKDIKDKKK
jgi:hypothetical protein